MRERRVITKDSRRPRAPALRAHDAAIGRARLDSRVPARAAPDNCAPRCSDTSSHRPGNASPAWTAVGSGARPILHADRQLQRTGGDPPVQLPLGFSCGNPKPLFGRRGDPRRARQRGFDRIAESLPPTGGLLCTLWMRFRDLGSTRRVRVSLTQVNFQSGVETATSTVGNDSFGASPRYRT